MFVTIGQAQIVTIPNANLKAKELQSKSQYTSFDFLYNPNLFSINKKEDVISQFITQITNTLSNKGGGVYIPPPPYGITTLSACNSYTWSTADGGTGQTYTTSGVYVVNGIGELHLTIIPSTTHTTTTSACASYTWSVNNQTYTTSGTYSKVTGCNTEYLNLTIAPTTSHTTTASACESYTWSLNNQTYTTSGTYSKVTGCNTEYLNLTITPSTSHTTTTSSCDSYTWSLNNQTYTTSGVYSVVNGCNTEYLNLTITPTTNHTTTASACNSFTWSVNNQTYTTSGTYSVVNGCDTQYLNLTITPSTNHTTTASACDNYTWSLNNQTYTTSGTYSVVNGCDTQYLNLTITPSTSHTTTASACDNYTWSLNNQTYTTSGIYSIVNGCDSQYLNLTITPKTNHTTTASACDSYTWSLNNQTYTTSGIYSVVNGCDTQYLNLTITPSTNHTTTASACDTYTWSLNNQTYTNSGIYSIVSGCSTEYLNLTITPSTSNTTTASACGSYTWSLNNQTYTTSGIYSLVNGCDTQYLNLTINNSLITSQPVNPVLCATIGSTASVSVSSNVLSPIYSWQYRVVTTAQPNPTWITITSTNAGTIYIGYTTATLGIKRTTTTVPNVGTQYRVIVGGGSCGIVTSNPSNLTIMGVVKAGTITSAASVCIGNDITFNLSGYVGTSIQWQTALNATSTFVDVLGATSPSFTASTMQLTSNKSYRAVITNSSCGTTATTAAKTIIVDPTSVAGIITGGGDVCEGSSGTLKISGYVGKIQWEYSTDGLNYSNAPKATDNPVVPFGTSSSSSTSTSYLINTISSDLYFRAKLTSGNCTSVYTTPVQYTIRTQAVVGTISQSETTLCPANGTTISLSDAIGIITWQKSTNFTATTPTWSSTTNHTLTFPTGNLTVSTAYRAMSTIGSCSTVYSDVVYVNIVSKPLAKAITANVTTPSGSTINSALCNNTPKILTIGNVSLGLIQWQTSTTSSTTGFIDIPGATDVSYTITNPIVGVNFYRAKFTNSCGVFVYDTAVALYYKNCIVSKNEITTLFDVRATPNPFADTFNLTMTTSSEEIVGISIYDMTGKLIDVRKATPNEIPELKIGDVYPSGVYNIVVTQGEEVKTLRIIKR